MKQFCNCFSRIERGRLFEISAIYCQKKLRSKVSTSKQDKQASKQTHTIVTGGSKTRKRKRKRKGKRKRRKIRKRKRKRKGKRKRKRKRR